VKLKAGLILLIIFSAKTIYGRTDSTEKKIRILPFPDLGYSPETRWYVGAVALFTVRFYDDTLTRKSNFKTEIIATQNKQVVGTLKHEIYLHNNSYQFTGSNTYYNYPEYFWGIGNNTTEEMKELYSAHRIELDDVFFKQVLKNTFAGVRYRLQNMYDIHTEEGSKIDGGVVTGAEGGLSSGLGYTINFDTRDNVLNSRRGVYISFSNLFFRERIGSDFIFDSYEADVRKYFSLSRNHVFALQATAVSIDGNAPFRMLPLVGGENTMRGYYTGRYRDKKMVTAQVEYRVHIWKAFGAALFAGAGQVSPSFHELQWSGYKPTYGAGLRIRVDKADDVNLRFDYAAGKNTSGFYVVYAEAF
jgi:outer membrane protein assembly factor BamA